MTNTINETYEYHLVYVIKRVLDDFHFVPKNPDELFNFLHGRGAERFAKAIVGDMVDWDDEDNWFNKIV